MILTVPLDPFVDDVDLGLPKSMGGDGTDAAPDPNEERSWFIEDSAITKLHLEGEGGLKKEIRRRGVLPKGKKAGLQQMLRDLVAKRMPITNEPDKNMEALGGFPVGSKWKVLEPISDVVEDPVNKFAFRPPTRGEDEEPTTTKHNYSEEFDCPVFTGRNAEGEV